MLQGDLYPRYVDGEGWVNDETRDAGYCPICNPKNYEAWEKRIAVEKERKEALKKKLAEKEEEDLRVKELDRSRAAESVSELLPPILPELSFVTCLFATEPMPL